jgi:lysophospholipase L1-like esterase
MAHFFQALERTERKQPGALTKIAHYGDSPTTADMITGDARGLLQNQYGDAGHGFLLIAKPWAWYEHRGVSLTASGWRIDPATQSQVRDGMFGLGGVAFFSSGGAVSRIRLRDPAHTAVEISFLRAPGGGTFTAFAGEEKLGDVNTAAGTTASGFVSFPLPPGTRDIELRAAGGGPVRLFGVTLSKHGPGVAYDSLGLNGAYVSVPARMFQERHWIEQLRHRRPDLVIVNYGTNESVYAQFIEQSYEKELLEIIRRVRAALPETSILVMSPMDRGQRDASGDITTNPAITRLVHIQERIAAGARVAFFNTYEAMGGAGTMGRWYQAEPRLVGADFTHPMPAGAKLVGGLLYQALIDGYNRHKLRNMRAGAKEPSARQL